MKRHIAGHCTQTLNLTMDHVHDIHSSLDDLAVQLSQV